MSFVLVTPPTVEPLNAADARLRLNIGPEIVDATLNALISTARLKIERQYGVAMITQTLDYIIDRFPGCSGALGFNQNERGFYSSQSYFNSADLNSGRPFRVGQTDIVLPISPVQQVMAISYFDSTGSVQPVDPATYGLNIGDLQSRVTQAFGQTWPTTQFMSGAIRVRLKAGFGDTPDKVPDTLKTVIALQVNYLRSMMAQNIFVSLDAVTGVGEKRYVVGKAGTDVIDAAVAALMQDYVRPSL
jgi:hypothetical protein